MSISQRVYDPVLSAHAKVASKQGTFVAESLFPTVFVTEYGGQVIEYGDEEFYESDDSRVPGGKTARIEAPEYTGQDFALKYHALEGKVPMEHMADAAVPGIDLQRNSVSTVVKKMMLKRERQAAALANNTSNYPAGNVTTLAGVTQWSDASGGDPFGDVANSMELVRSLTGMMPNTAVTNAVVLKALKNNPQVRENFKYTDASSITTEMLMAYLEVDTLVVGNGLYVDSAGVKQNVWGNHLVLAYVAPGQTGISYDQAEPSYGYTYTFQGHPAVVPGYYEPNRFSWFYPVKYDRKAVISSANSAAIIANAAA